MKKHNPILIYSIGAIIVTINLWLLSKPSFAVIIDNPFQSLSQVFALIAIVLLSFELLLVSRLKFLETFVGPLDQVYTYHKHLSVFSLISMITHIEFLLIRSISSSLPANLYLFPTTNNLPYSTGVIAFYLFSLTIILTLYFKLPYQIWKFVHRVLSLATLLAGYHILTIQSDISSNILLRVWVLGVFALGLLSMLYKVFVYKRVSKKYQYSVAKIVDTQNIVKLFLTPSDKKMQYQGGEFAYFTFLSNEITKEEHPFSIASRPDSDQLMLGIKKVGDYTTTLAKLRVLDKVEIRGPYGKFGTEIPKAKKEIWLGAGIGITPLLSQKLRVPTKLFYVLQSDNRIFDNELSQLAQLGAEVHVHESNISGRFNLESLIAQLKDENTYLRVCAPISMINDIKELLRNQSINPEKVIYEDFDLFN